MASTTTSGFKSATDSPFGSIRSGTSPASSTASMAELSHFSDAIGAAGVSFIPEYVSVSVSASVKAGTSLAVTPSTAALPSYTASQKDTWRRMAAG